MAGSINHVFVSTVPDEGVDTEVGPDEWNDGLVVSGGSDGQAMVRRVAAADGWELAYLGAPPAFVNVTQAANSGTGETTLHTHTLPVDFFNANKRGIRIVYRGSFAANGNAKTLRFKFGSSAAIVLNPVQGSPNGLRFEVEILVFRTASDAQVIYCKTRIGLTGAIDFDDKSTDAEDDGATIAMLFTGQSAVASSDILLDHSQVEFLA